MSHVIIEASGLSAQFTSQALNLFTELKLTLCNTCYFLIGRNGCGKSVLAALLAKLSQQVKYFGRVAYLSQELDPFHGTMAEKLTNKKYLAALDRVKGKALIVVLDQSAAGLSYYYLLLCVTSSLNHSIKSHIRTEDSA